MSSCNGDCCEQFVLPYSKEILKRMAQEGISRNGSTEEIKVVADMVIPLNEGKSVKNKFTFTCRHFDKETRKCSIYERRPVVCRTHGGEINGVVCGNRKSLCAEGCPIATCSVIAESEFTEIYGKKPNHNVSEDKYL